MACEPKYLGVFVNVYLIGRSYGGPEEGGWWYDCGQAISSTEVKSDALYATNGVFNKEKEWCETENNSRHSDINSVLSEGKYIVRVEPYPAEDFPSEIPRYE